MLRALLLAFLFIAAPAMAQTPQAALDELLAADRAFASGAATLDPVAGITAMLDEEAVMPQPGKGILAGKAAVAEAFAASPAFKEGHVSWAPVRGGISADGTQGFTYGFLTVGSGDETKRARKYLSYWIKRPVGWRVVAYRQLPRDPGEISTAMMQPALPAFTARELTDPAIVARHQESLAAAEKSFSDHAQNVGLKKAFRDFGRDDAMNMWGGANFRVGPDAIATGFEGEDGPAKIHWSTEKSFVASSGDLGLSIGTIRPNAPKPGEPDGFPFFTVWKRDGPNAPWRYIAE